MTDHPNVVALYRGALVVSVPPWMVKELGIAAIWFAQVLWRMNIEDTTTIIRGDHEWEDETGLNRGQVVRAKQKVVDRGWITTETHKVKGTPTTHICLAIDALEADLRTIHCPISDNPGSRVIGQSSLQEIEEDTSARAIGDPPNNHHRRTPSRKTSAPMDFAVTSDMRDWARSKNLTVDLDAETELFLSHAEANGKQFASWPAGWRTWMLRSQEYRKRDQAKLTSAAPEWSAGDYE